MNRRNFLKSTAILGLSAAGGILLSNTFLDHEEVILPSIDGDLKILIPRRGLNIIAPAYADPNYYNNSYQSMAPYQQMLAYQQAWAEWRNQLIQYQIQRYQWIQRQQIQALSQMMQDYSGYQIGQPGPWDAIKSIYGFAVSNNQPSLFGVNQDSRPVKINKTLQGAGAVFAKVGEYFNQSTQEKAVGPQTSEFPARIVLPNGSTLDGNGYETKYGALGVSNGIVQTEDGKTGQLAKYKLGSDGNQYLIV